MVLYRSNAVLAPLGDDATFFDSAPARQSLAQIQASLADLPNVISTSDPTGSLAVGPEAATAAGSISPDGRVALVRLHKDPVEGTGGSVVAQHSVEAEKICPILQKPR